MSAPKRCAALAGVILAAGLSGRFGRNKLLEPFRGRPLLRWTIDAALRSRLGSITLVLGHEYERMRAALSDLAGEPRLAMVFNPAYAEGQSRSVIAGLSAIPAGSVAAMFLVGDQPLLDHRAIDRLISAFDAAGGGICYPVCDGRRGNPVIFASAFFPELRRLRGDGGGRTVIDNNRSACVPVEFPRGSLFSDVDFVNDIERLTAEDAPACSTSLVQALELQGSRVISLCGSGGKTSLMSALVREFSRDPAERLLVTTTTKMGLQERDGPWRALAAQTADEALAVIGSDEQPILIYHHLDPARERLRGLPASVVDELARSGRFTRILVETDGSRRRPLKAPSASEPVFPAETDTVIAVAGLAGLGHPLDDDIVFRADRWSVLSGLSRSDPVTPLSLAQVICHPEGLMRHAPARARRLLVLNQADMPSQAAMAGRVLDSLAALGGKRPARAAVTQLQARLHVHSVRTFDEKYF